MHSDDYCRGYQDGIDFARRYFTGARRNEPRPSILMGTPSGPDPMEIAPEGDVYDPHPRVDSDPEIQ